jgi:hypothetical protein
MTERELLDKRGFCPVCDARFELGPGLLLGDGPLRAIDMVAAQAVEAPSQRVSQREQAGELTVSIAPPGPSLETGRLLICAVAWWAFLLFWYTAVLHSSGPLQLLFLIFPIGHVAAGVAMLWQLLWDLFGREELSVAPAGLSRRRALLGLGRERQVPLAEVDRLELAEPGERIDSGRQRKTKRPQLLVHRRGSEPLVIADHGLSTETLRWVQQRLGRALEAERRRPG